MSNELQANRGQLEYGLEILQEISGFRPYSSISFPLPKEIISSLYEASRVVDWGMAKNKHKMKAAVVSILDTLASNSPGEPANLNLPRHERKSIRAAAKLIRRILKGEKTGISLK